MKEAFTLPNLISLARIAGSPVFAYVLLVGHERHAAAWMLGVLGATDWLDGWLARRLGTVTDLGKVLDPVADRVLIVVAAVAVLVDGAFPLWLGIVVLVREALVSIGVLALALLGAKRIDVLWVGKAGTFALMLSVPMFLVAAADLSWSGIARVIAWGSAAVAVVLGWWAAAGYVPLAASALRDRRTSAQNPP
ncbi:MAG TPA: CDP-alcohol phosphatidyltransferase family protein [Acidimicrobiales bacterium]|nr:CDP-alcohol phosphatidyltransferase family protein [Acidimicrobiales bacterium]